MKLKTSRINKMKLLKILIRKYYLPKKRILMKNKQNLIDLCKINNKKKCNKIVARSKIKMIHHSNNSNRKNDPTHRIDMLINMMRKLTMVE